MTVPIFIVCHNNGWMVRNTVEALLGRFENTSLFITDEASTAPRTLRVLDELQADHGVTVHRHLRNVGPKRVRRYPQYWRVRRKPFILTDPDLDLSRLPSDTIDLMRSVADDQNLRCVGLALDISDPDDFLDGPYFEGKSIVEWEARFWRDPVDLSHLRPDIEAWWAPIDTTFAYYDFSRPKVRQIRIAGEYTVRHLPWHKSYIKSLDPRDFSDYFARELPFGTIAPLVQGFMGERPSRESPAASRHDETSR